MKPTPRVPCFLQSCTVKMFLRHTRLERHDWPHQLPHQYNIILALTAINKHASFHKNPSTMSTQTDIDGTTHGPYWCHVCSRDMQSLKNFEQHKRGRKHLRRLSQRSNPGTAAGGLPLPNTNSAQRGLQENVKSRSPTWSCSIC